MYTSNIQPVDYKFATPEGRKIITERFRADKNRHNDK